MDQLNTSYVPMCQSSYSEDDFIISIQTDYWTTGRFVWVDVYDQGSGYFVFVMESLTRTDSVNGILFHGISLGEKFHLKLIEVLAHKGFFSWKWKR